MIRRILDRLFGPAPINHTENVVDIPALRTKEGWAKADEVLKENPSGLHLAYPEVHVTPEGFKKFIDPLYAAPVADDRLSGLVNLAAQEKPPAAKKKIVAAIPRVVSSSEDYNNLI